MNLTFWLGFLSGAVSLLAGVGIVGILHKLRRRPGPKTPLEAVLQLLVNPEEIWTYTADGLYLVHRNGLAIPTQHHSPSIYLNSRAIVPWSHVPGTQENRVRDAIKLAAARAVMRPRGIAVEKKVETAEPSNDLFSELIDGS
jgi:hypothetical protein